MRSRQSNSKLFELELWKCWMQTIIHIYQIIYHHFFKHSLLVWLVLVPEFHHYYYVKCLKNCVSYYLRSVLIVLVEFIKSNNQLTSVDCILLINLCLIKSWSVVSCEFFIESVDNSSKRLVHLCHLNYFILVSVDEWTVKSVRCLLITLVESFKIFIQSLHLTILTRNDSLSWVLISKSICLRSLWGSNNTCSFWLFTSALVSFILLPTSLIFSVFLQFLPFQLLSFHNFPVSFFLFFLLLSLKLNLGEFTFPSIFF